MCAVAKIVTGHQTGVDPVGVEIPIIDGDVQFDSTADVRGTLDLTTDGAYWPDLPTDLLTPYGNEIFIARGIEFGSGDRELVSQGYFRIDDVDQDDAPKGGPVKVSGKDRMAGIIDAKLTAPIQFTAGASVESVFNTLVLEVYPTATLEFDFDADTTTFAGSHIAEEDRYAFLLDIVRSLGKVMFWDYRGHLVVQDAPTPSGRITGRATAAGSALTTEYFICTDADAADIATGDTVRLRHANGLLKENTAFTVTSKDSTGGFTNIHYMPPSRVGTVTNDRMEAYLPPDTYDVNHGHHGVLVSMSRSRNRTGVFNAVVATGESPGDQAAVRAVAKDLDATSPTYWYGTFGKVPKFYSSPLITTVSQAGAAGAAILGRNLGLPYNVDFSMVPNPALEPLDLVRVSYRDKARVEVHVLEQLTIPLTAEGAMTANTRERANEDIGVEDQ